jgi:hypothetical protein
VKAGAVVKALLEGMRANKIVNIRYFIFDCLMEYIVVFYVAYAKHDVNAVSQVNVTWFAVDAATTDSL